MRQTLAQKLMRASSFLRGELVCENGKVIGPPRGRYLHRPT